MRIMNNNFEQKLHEWAVKAATQCHEIATSNDPNVKVDKFFYAFQTSPVENPDLLIIGLNPGEAPNEDWTYSDMIKKSGRTLDEDIKMMEKGNIVSLNCRTIPQAEQWENITFGVGNNLRKVFHTSELKAILYESSYMNSIYFNSGNFRELLSKPGGNGAIRACAMLTKEVVLDVIKPKQVLCLGTTDCFNIVGNAIGNGSNDYKVFAKNKRGTRLLVKKTFSNIPVYAIPHPTSAHGISDADRRLIGDLLAKEWL
jgi:hypothetical protein